MEPGPAHAWTMTGGKGQFEEALLSSDAAVAPWAEAPPVDFWLFDPASGTLHHPVGQGVQFSLLEGQVPIPQFRWEVGSTRVTGTLFHDLTDGMVRWRLTVENAGETSQDWAAMLAVRPFNIDQGISPILAAGWQGSQRLWLNGAPFMAAAQPADVFGVASLPGAPLYEAGQVPTLASIPCDPSGKLLAVARYDLSLGAGRAQTLDFAFPSAPEANDFPAMNVDVAARLAATAERWQAEVSRTRITLPDDRVAGGFPASVGYLLLADDPDGPHPGPLAHDAVWTRDAAYIGLALLQSGHADRARAYIPAILNGQELNGRVPPIQGPNTPWDAEEWDAQGQAIYLVTTTYRYTGDLELLREWYPAILRAAEFIRALRQSTAEADDATRGLLPPSLSAEDIGPADWHHYWDNFWAIAGLEEAAFAARTLGNAQDAAWLASEAEDLRAAVLRSIEQVMGPEPEYIPSAVEHVADSAMARGTVPALHPYSVLEVDSELVQRAFAFYHQRWIAPHAGGFQVTAKRNSGPMEGWNWPMLT
ncbi:MAG: hypothetical protein HC915_16395 [Anaerolineae bacterium]|nr:hypothetical protein [Anaerolineae bacterium]